MRGKNRVLSVLAGIFFIGSVSLAAPPVLEVSPLYMEFSAEQGGSNPASQALSIWKGGGNGPLKWNVTEDCNWFSVAPTSGTSMGEVDIVGVFVDINGLGAGTYNCGLTVDAGTAANSPQIVDVNLVVSGPEISLSATQFDFTASYGGVNPADKILSISNSGSGTLNWEITYDCNWLGVEPNDGNSAGEVDDVNLSVDITGLARGTYDCNLTVSDPNAMNSPQTVGVSLSIIAEGLWVEPVSFDVSVLEGTSLQETLAITNDGNEAVDYMVRSRPVGGSGGSALAKGGSADVGVVSSMQEWHDFTALGNSAYKAGEVIVRFAPAPDGQVQGMTERDGILSLLGGGHVKESFEIVEGLSSVKLPGWMSVEEALERFNGAQGILYAEPDYEVKADATYPFDPRFDELWGMHNTGQSGGTADADIDAPEAWDIGTGSDEVVVAVIDTGVDYMHPDLALNMWENEAEKNGTPGVDDDGNGYIDDIYGYDFYNNDGDPMDDMSPIYHGTHCSGTVGAIGDNGEGVAGVCWTVKIMAVKFLNSGGSGWTSDAIKCVDYARLMGADVTSNSWGGGGYSQGLKDAIDAAGAVGMLFVAAAGNSSSNTDSNPHYPSSYDCESLISVMSTYRNDAKSGFSNWGPTTVDLGAPGSEILSCKKGGAYQYLNGTSMATPHVAGACALLWSMDPALSNSEVKDILLRTVDVTLSGLCVSEGRLNLYDAILETRVPWIELEPAEGTLGPGDSNVIDVTFNAFEEGMEMPAGTYKAEIVVVSDDPCGPEIVPVTMTVNADDLWVNPHAGSDANGLEGGPFEPSCITYTLTNNGTVSVSWTTSPTPAWLEVEPNQGVLDANDWIDVNVCITAEANLLDPNIYSDSVIFENVGSGSIKPRPVTLTVRPADRFTESFGIDLDFLSLTFSPDGSNAYYEACRERVDEFPTDPNGGTLISLGDDDFAEVVLIDDANVLFYGTRYDRFYVGSNGYITFGQGDSNSAASLESHFALRRISGLFTDLDPSSGGNVSYKQFGDGVVVTFEDVPLSGDAAATNSFQIEMFFVDGSICVSWLEHAAISGVAGLSKGGGLPPVYFSESDLTGYLPCRPWCDVSRDYGVNFEDYVVFALHWLEEDCGIPYWCDKTDFDLSGTADGVDLKIFSEDWLQTNPWWLEPVAHWKLDEGAGDAVYDWSRFHHGIVNGAAWTSGYIDGALDFDGVDDYVTVSSPATLDDLPLGDMTICAWIYDEYSSGTTWGTVVGCYAYDHGWHLRTFSNASGDRSLYFQVPHSTTWADYWSMDGTIQSNAWHHVAAVWDAATKTAKLYVDGTETSYQEAIGGAGSYNSDASRNKNIGRIPHVGGVHYFNGAIDDVRLYDRALTVEEIPNVILSWSPGGEAVSHDVYFGTNFSDVNDANTLSPAYMASQDVNTWDVNNYDADGLAFETTYYWRIDEVNEADVNSPWRGDVWSFTTWGEFGPSLIGYWKFDEGSGGTAHDLAGDNDGTIYGAVWTSGKINSGLNFDGSNDYVSVGSPSSLDDLPLHDMAVSAWIYDEYSAGTTWGTVAGCYNRNHGWHLRTVSNASGDRSLYFQVPHATTWSDYQSADGTIQSNAWHHVAAVWYAATKTAKLYIDGAETSYQKTIAGVGAYNSDASQSKNIGRIPHVGGVHYFDGTIDDVRLFDRALSAEEVGQLYEQGLIEKASNPNPRDEATGVDPNAVLSWSPGYLAISHDVYFGSDFNSVNDATTTSPECMGNQESTSWDPCGLDSNSTYYWRIDEVNESEANSPWKGDIWRFTTWAEFDPNLGLVSWWEFDEGSGTTAYDSAGDNDGALNGDTAWTSGQINGALSFDGDADYVESANSIADLPMGDHTVCLWVKKDNLDSEGIISAGDGVQWWLLSYGSQYSAYVAQWDDDVNKKYIYTDSPAVVGAWTHLAMRREGTEYSLFMNGAKQGDTETVNNDFQVEENIRIGMAQFAPEGVTGSLDDVRIYSRALGAGEIWQLYQSGL
ncbi:MAG: LamG-like jellyroll fold domain-containing protein [Planctomycetota bacterium]|jgi:subtilisin family serine protease